MTFQQLIEELSENGADFRVRRYSGRGMFGQECLSVVADNPMAAISLIAEEAGRRGIALPPRVRQDQMGLGTVIYWPDTPFVAKEGTT